MLKPYCPGKTEEQRRNLYCDLVCRHAAFVEWENDVHRMPTEFSDCPKDTVKKLMNCEKPDLSRLSQAQYKNCRLKVKMIENHRNSVPLELRRSCPLKTEEQRMNLYCGQDDERRDVLIKKWMNGGTREKRTPDDIEDRRISP